MKRFEARRAIVHMALGLLPIVLATSCAVRDAMVPSPLDPGRVSREPAQQAIGSTAGQDKITQVPPVPEGPAIKLKSGKPDVPAPTAPAKNEEANITVSFDQLPLPSFIQTIYRTILKKNLTVD